MAGSKEALDQKERGTVLNNDSQTGRKSRTVAYTYGICSDQAYRPATPDRACEQWGKSTRRLLLLMYSMSTGGRARMRQQNQNKARRTQSKGERKSVDTGTLPAHIPVGRAGLLAVDRREVLERALGVGLHRLVALVPVRGAHLAVLVLADHKAQHMSVPRARRKG